MINRGVATFTLDYGKCPKWLFERMVKLGQEIIYAVMKEKGPDEFIRRIADPVWFQSLGTVLAFDWNASGLTTVLTAALKEGIKNQEKDLGIFICGGKGKTSRKTPEEIEWAGYKAGISEDKTKALIYNSKMAAKVDSALIQDGFQIYHHSFFFTKTGAWTVVQQGMNIQNQTARRYHWYSENIHPVKSAESGVPPKAEQFNQGKDLVQEPHTGITSDIKLKSALNLTAEKSADNRKISTELVAQNFNSLLKDIKILSKYYTPVSQMVDLQYGPASVPQNAGLQRGEQQRLKFLNLENKEYKWHPVVREDFSKSKYLQKILWELCQIKPRSYEKLLATKGVGPKTIRALALISEIIYGAKSSYEDPARYSFAYGGKDGTPYFVDRKTYDQTIQELKEFVKSDIIKN